MSQATMNRNEVGRAVRCAPGHVARETKEPPTTFAAGRGQPALPSVVMAGISIIWMSGL